MQDFKGYLNIIRKKMKTFMATAAGRNFLFFLILAVLVSGLSVSIQAKLKNDDSLVQNRDKSLIRIGKEKADTIDLLVVGDSLSYTSVFPAQLWKEKGIASYICGQPGQKLPELYEVLETALREQNPKVVMIETNVLFRKIKGVQGFAETLEGRAGELFPVFRFHDIWKSVLLGKRYREASSKGFRIREWTGAYHGGNYMKKTKKIKHLSCMTEHYIDQILELCRQKGIQVLLYSAPSPHNYNYKKHNALVKMAKNKGLKYLDLNLKTAELQINWMTDSLDRGDHLNLNGAEKVTSYLAAYLTEQYHLPDRRGDERYQSWQTDADRLSSKMREG